MWKHENNSETRCEAQTAEYLWCDIMRYLHSSIINTHAHMEKDLDVYNQTGNSVSPLREK